MKVIILAVFSRFLSNWLNVLQFLPCDSLCSYSVIQLYQDVTLIGDGLTNGLQREKRQDIMIDSSISHSHYVEVERELERWTPNEDDPQCLELEDTFDATWNRWL